MFEIQHPEGLFCDACGSGTIVYWPELKNWKNLSEEEKADLVVCAACQKELRTMLKNDVARCHDASCEQALTCLRFLERAGGTLSTGHVLTLRDRRTGECDLYLEAMIQDIPLVD